MLYPTVAGHGMGFVLNALNVANRIELKSLTLSLSPPMYPTYEVSCQ